MVEFFDDAEIMPSSMIDISDGLSSEILHLCKQSNLGCVLYEEKIPVDEEARQFAYKLEIDHLQQQHHDLDIDLKNELQHFGNDRVISDLKKKKLSIKDEIERLKKK